MKLLFALIAVTIFSSLVLAGDPFVVTGNNGVCTDTDGNPNKDDLLTAGNVSLQERTGKITNAQDACATEDSVYGYYCSARSRFGSIRVSIGSRLETCPAGTTCSNGACVKQPSCNITTSPNPSRENQFFKIILSAKNVNVGLHAEINCGGKLVLASCDQSKGVCIAECALEAGEHVVKTTERFAAQCAAKHVAEKQSCREIDVSTIQVNGTNQSRNYCVDKQTAGYYACRGNELVTQTTLRCAETHQCVKGVCMPRTTPQTCVDSDGDNPDTAGSIKLTGGIYEQTYGSNGLTLNDSCNPPTERMQLTEFVCNAQGTDGKGKQYNCPNGCKNGACVPKDNECGLPGGVFKKALLGVNDQITINGRNLHLVSIAHVQGLGPSAYFEVRYFGERVDYFSMNEKTALYVKNGIALKATSVGKNAVTIAYANSARVIASGGIVQIKTGRQLDLRVDSTDRDYEERTAYFTLTDNATGERVDYWSMTPQSAPFIKNGVAIKLNKLERLNTGIWAEIIYSAYEECAEPCTIHLNTTGVNSSVEWVNVTVSWPGGDRRTTQIICDAKLTEYSREFSCLGTSPCNGVCYGYTTSGRKTINATSGSATCGAAISVKIANSCTDSDAVGGNDFNVYERGTIIVSRDGTVSSTAKYADACFEGGKQLVEYGCGTAPAADFSIQNGLSHGSIFNCLDGCRNGACVKQPSCREIDVSTIQVNGTNQSRNYCVDKQTAGYYACNGNELTTQTTLKCAETHQCVKGACVPLPKPQSHLLGLVGEWAFDEGSGTIALDSSGNGNVGTITGASWSNECVKGSCLSFNGNSQVRMPASATLDTKREITLAAWIKPEGNQVQPILEYNNGRKWGVHLWQYAAPGTLYTNLGSTDGTDNPFSKTGQITQSQWQHVATTYDGNIATAYVNGKQVTTLEISKLNLQTTYDLYVGKRPNTNYAYKGAIDEVRVWGRALTPQEVATLYRNEKPSGSPISGAFVANNPLEKLVENILKRIGA